jgi:hypothetical protein
MTFGPDGVLFAADPKAATIFCARPRAPRPTAARRALADVCGELDGKIAALLGTETASIAVERISSSTPRRTNAYISRSCAAPAPTPKPALLRVDGDGAIQRSPSESLLHQ